ncbi:MAG: type VI secretion system tip protein TssI/VgrG [Polyangiaceae bacterium]
MENLSLVLACEADLTVKSFVAREAISSPYDIEIVAYTPADSLPFEAIVGHKASFTAASPWADAAPRTWTGMVHRIEQIDAEPSGATTYSIHLAPPIWRLGRRIGSRIFQHLTIPEIALALLAEWEIVPALRLDPAAFPKHEYRVQYNETDLTFLSRLLEEAGIAYIFDDPEPPSEKDPQPWSRLVLAEDATRRDPRAVPLEYWNVKDLPTDRDAVAQVRASREVRAGRATLRDFDYRQRPAHKLFATSAAASDSESRIEAYEYIPGAFVIEPSADAARVDEREAQSRADKALAAARGGRFTVSYRANVLDLAPGAVFSMKGHPHPELGDQRALLAIAHRIEGTRSGEWTVTGEATYGDEPHRPARRTSKPRIAGVQSALVVGPAGEEIHTDAMGRVRVEFPWDREGQGDERSSCFLRVSQGWAGPGYGIVAVPRVGEEVLVSFFDGDPDQPVIVGRVHNGTAPPPEPLPASKTKSVWRTNSTPGGGGYSELAIDDMKGEELVALRAERDYERLVLREERATIGSSLSTKVGAGESHEVTADQVVKVGGNRTIAIAGSDTLSVAEALHIDIGGAGGTFSKDKKIVLTTGEASIVLDGPNLYIDAKAIVALKSGDALMLSGGDVKIDGQPNVSLNGGVAAPPTISLLNGSHYSAALQLPPGAPPLNALEDLLNSPIFDPGKAPGELSLPPEIEAQLAALRNKVMAGLEEIVSKIEKVPDILDQIGQDVLPEVEAAYAAAMAKIEQARKWLEDAKARIAAEIEKWKAEILALKARVEAVADEIKAKIQAAIASVQAKITALRDKARALIQSVKDTIQEYKDKVKAEFEYWKGQAIAFKNKVVGPFEEIRKGIKDLTTQVKETVAEFKESITGIVEDVKTTVKDIKETVQNIKKEVKDLFGLKSAFKEIKEDVKETVEEVKEAWNEAKDGVKDAFDDVKSIFKGEDGEDGFSLFQGANPSGIPENGGSAFQPPAGKIGGQGGNLKLPGGDAARAANVGQKGLPNLTGPAARGAAQHTPGHIALQGGNGAGQALSGAATSHGSQALAGSVAKGAGGSGFDLQRLASEAGDAAGQAGSLSAPAGSKAAEALAGSVANGAPKNPLLGSTVVTRAGGFSPTSLADAVNAAQAAETPVLLQSPSEGQLLVVRTQKAAALSPDDFTRAFVDHQMDGLPPSDAYAAALQANGYLVYERPWDGWLVSMLKKAVL